MKVLTKSVVFEDQEFVLIKSEHDGSTYYGTIPCTELDEHGCLKRMLTGADMRISWESPAAALENRRRDVVMSRLLRGFEEQGMDMMDALKAMAECEEYRQLYAGQN